MHWRRKWQSTPVFLPGESQGWGSLVGCRLWGRTELDTTEVIMPQSRSSESARVATLPTRGPELSAQEQMEGLLCRKQEMEAFGKKAANRYWVWPHRAEALSAPGSRQACPEPLPRLGEGVGLRSRVGPQWGREGRETINKMGLRWHWC